MAAAGVFLGFPAVLTALFYSVFAGGVCAAIVLIWRGESRPVVEDLSVTVGKLAGLDALSLRAIPPRGGAFPFGVAIAAGTIATVVLGRLG
jgi:Flp pilus assembly protein protease CpaA